MHAGVEDGQRPAAEDAEFQNRGIPAAGASSPKQFTHGKTRRIGERCGDFNAAQKFPRSKAIDCIFKPFLTPRLEFRLQVAADG